LEHGQRQEEESQQDFFSIFGMEEQEPPSQQHFFSLAKMFPKKLPRENIFFTERERQEGQANFTASPSSISRMVACTLKREEQSLQR